MRIIWSDFALSKLDNIYSYYVENASEKVAYNLVEGIITKIETLTESPFIGQKEELLIEYEEDFRYLIFKNYKIIYDFLKNENIIRIWNVFDARQNPTKIKKIK